jgi:hypothetical protein
MPVSKGRKVKKGAPKPNTRQASPPSRNQTGEKLGFYFPESMKAFLVWASIVLGIIASVAVFIDYYRQTYPEFVENNSDISSPIALPFAIQMPSIFFRMTNVRLVCDVQNVVFETNNGKKIGFSIPVTSGYENKADISKWSPGSYDCDAANYLHVKNGDISLLGLHAAMPEASSAKILTQTIQIGIKYKVWWKEREGLSPTFTWEPTAAGHYWRKGEVLR